ncbi:class II fructose-bisphosphate aldolase [Acidipropionibacterium acidipropionici]|uniref:Iron ABC transporter substrate-binding protein n=1 Tax=Acidipropionibacterium acidipropionici TaxID=1748 RepID=A0AAC8YCR5_9ACTN|nr:class II fructose-bisphosphate aldolase [Acidipropionibacterium acidipropionici]AMS04140.1 iron ABC transporter substrate-binding protein [Acidipropionibacterium acidipropionici]
MYTTITPLLSAAAQTGYTVGAFNAHNLEMLPPMIQAARDLGAPIIIQTSAGTARYVGMRNFVAVCRTLADNEAVDVALHLDHATSIEDIEDAITAGYSSVMYDGSALPFTQNIVASQRVVEYAHARDVSVEAEIGTIGGTEDGIEHEHGNYTQPEEVTAFLDAVDCDALAISIGTNHGQFRDKTQLDFPLLERIHAVTDRPLVVHGGTGVDEADYPRLMANGIRKFNVGTELLVGWTRSAQEALAASPVNRSLRHNMIPANDTVRDVVSHKITLFLGVPVQR